MNVEDSLKLKKGDILSVVFGISPYIEVLDNCEFLSEFEGQIYFDNKYIRSYVYSCNAFHTHKEAVEWAVHIAKNEIRKHESEISELTKRIKKLKQDDIRRV